MKKYLLGQKRRNVGPKAQELSSERIYRDGVGGSVTSPVKSTRTEASSSSMMGKTRKTDS